MLQITTSRTVYLGLYPMHLGNHTNFRSRLSLLQRTRAATMFELFLSHIGTGSLHNVKICTFK